MRDFCNKCQTNYRIRTTHHLKERHKICKREWRTEWEARNPNYKRQHYLKTNYGLSIQEYNGLFVEQLGCCAICGKHQRKFTYALGVDHCHKTNEVRGLLCKSCNLMLGEAKDDQSLLQRGIQYLTKHDLKKKGK